MPVDRDYAHAMFQMVESVQFLKAPELGNNPLIIVLHYSAELDAKIAMSYFRHAFAGKAILIALEIDVNDNLLLTIESKGNKNWLQFLTGKFNQGELKQIKLPGLTGNATAVYIQFVSPKDSEDRKREVITLQPNKMNKQAFYGLEAKLIRYTDYSFGSNLWRFQ